MEREEPCICGTSTPVLVCLVPQEYTHTPSRLAIITVLCADLQRYLSRMCGGPPDIILCALLCTIDTGGEEGEGGGLQGSTS
jgi:hypothetical protein